MRERGGRWGCCCIVVELERRRRYVCAWRDGTVARGCDDVGGLGRAVGSRSLARHLNKTTNTNKRLKGFRVP